MTQQNPIINKSTGISIGLVMTVLGSGFFGYGKLESRLDGIENELRESKYIVRNIMDRQDSRWSSTDMEIWVERLKSKNPNVDVPDIPSHLRHD
ncbi:MAG: hypothetical protein DRQ48_03890 [Gammaproteobacteria bacterium]|nr:MAG: hypothetical protein DRQ48_03890 [Gammaproteobacteria bacterium]